jgi:hypothetical protein
MKSKGHLYIYIRQYTQEELHVLRTVIVFGLSKTRKVIR